MAVIYSLVKYNASLFAQQTGLHVSAAAGLAVRRRMDYIHPEG